MIIGGVVNGVVNWYLPIKLSFPHIEETCPKCRKKFFADLLWEHQSDSLGHHFTDKEGKNIPQQYAKANPDKVWKEFGEQSIECPYCEYKWNSFFEKDYVEGGEVEEIPTYDNDLVSTRMPKAKTVASTVVSTTINLFKLGEKHQPVLDSCLLCCGYPENRRKDEYKKKEGKNYPSGKNDEVPDGIED